MNLIISSNITRLLIFVFTLLMSSSVNAQFSDVIEVKYPSYKLALKAGDDSLSKYKYVAAASAYFNAKTQAKNDEEIAAAYMGLAKSIANFPPSSDYRNVKGGPTWSEKQAEKARTTFLYITQLPKVSDDTRAIAFLAMTDYYKSGSYEYRREALKYDLYTQILALKNINPQMRIKVLLLRRNKQDFLDLLEIKEATDIDKANAYAGLAGQSYSTDKKLEYYEKIIDLKNITPYWLYTYLFDAAKIYSEQKKIDTLRKILRKIDNLDGVPFEKTALAYRNIAQTYLYEKNIPVAKKEMAKIGKIKNGKMDEYVTAFVNNAATYISYQLFDEAQQEYKDALNVKGITDNFKAYVYYFNGEMYYNKSNIAEARKVWDKVSNLKTDSSYLPYKLKAIELIGKSYYAEKNYKEAAKAFQQMINVKESAAKEKLIARFLLAQVFTIDNKIKQATEQYEIILKDSIAGLSLRVQAGMANIAQYKVAEEPKILAEAITALTPVIMYPSFKLKLSAEDKTMYDKLQNQFKTDSRKTAEEFSKEKATIPYAINIHKSFVEFKGLTDIYELTRHWQSLAKIYEGQKNIEDAKIAYEKIIELGVKDSKKQAELALEKLK